MMVADSVRAENADQPFKNIIIASGTNYADALSASYLAAVKNAPILITSEHEPVIDSIVEYIKSNAANDCQIYIIGGEAAVSEKIVTSSHSSVFCVSAEKTDTVPILKC
jgi:putative cell wall-binding protein